jgi:CubicO group peptidase (beta-lactamase class C family)
MLVSPKFYFQFSIIILMIFNSCAYASTPRHFPSGVQEVTITPQSGVRSSLLNNITTRIEKSINDGYYPGAIVLVSHRGHIIYKGVFGNRRIQPDIAPMTFDTLFDLASLSKVVGTTPAIMLLVEKGKLELDAPVARYWPAFGNNGKSEVTVRELMTHTSGLIADITDPKHPNDHPSWQGEASALQQIVDLKLNNPAGTTFVYSDVNYIVLGYLIEQLTGQRLDQYVQKNIFKPLEMTDTQYLPAGSLRDRIAPTEIIEKQLRWGEVHDSSAHAMGGVAGNAGVFSDASDLAIYAQCLLDGGRIGHGLKGKKKSDYLLGPLTVYKMTTPQSPVGMTEVRGLGWDIDSPYSARGLLFPTRSYGHTGFTGTSLWIDPVTQTFIIVLTSRTHPTMASYNQLMYDRHSIANIVAGSITDVTTNMDNTGVGEINRAYLKSPDKNLALSTVRKRVV